MSLSVRTPALAFAAGATLLSFCLPASADEAAPRKNACAFVGQINNFKEIDDRSAIFETSPSRRYKVTFYNSCREMRWALFARVVSHGGTCLRPGDKIIVGRHGFADYCIVRTVEALPPKQRTAQHGG